MRKLLLLTIICAAATICSAQQRLVDSLEQLIAAYPNADSGKVKLLMNLARATVYTNPDSMMAFANEALAISREIDWRPGIARSLQLKGVAYSYALNDQASALEYYHRALDANNHPADPVLELNTIANIAVIFYNMKQLDESLRYYQKAMVLLDQVKGRPGEEQLNLNMGNVYYDRHQRDSANYYFTKSLALAESRGNTMIQIGALNALATSLIDAASYAGAKDYVLQSLALSDQTGNVLTRAVSLVNLALIQLHTGHADSATFYGTQALAAATRAGSRQFRREAYNVLSLAEEAQGNYRDALSAARQFNSLNDSLLSDESQQQVTRLEMQYNFDKKQALDTAEIKRQKVIRNATAAIAALLVLVSLGGILVYKKRKDILQQKKEAEFSARVVDTEMKALRAQMNPHFIYNSLNSINDYIDRHDTGKATAYTTRFAKLMRMILENSEKKEVPLEDDLAALELYMQLENMRREHKFEYEIRVEEGIDRENTLIPPLILQPFVENSIWHGFSGQEGDARIFIDIKKQGDMISCSVEDNGRGMPPASPAAMPQRKSLGMKITRARIDILNSIKKSNAAVNISRLERGTRIEVTFPEALAF